VWTTEINEGQPPRCQAMTGLSGDQVAELVEAVFDLLGGVWQPVRGAAAGAGPVPGGGTDLVRDAP
jgi:hypothetical protein